MPSPDGTEGDTQSAEIVSGWPRTLAEENTTLVSSRHTSKFTLMRTGAAKPRLCQLRRDPSRASMRGDQWTFGQPVSMFALLELQSVCRNSYTHKLASLTRKIVPEICFQDCYELARGAIITALSAD